MALEGFEPIVLRVFGGLCTYVDRLALGLGLSPSCQNVAFAPGIVKTRDPYRNWAGTTESAAIDSIKYFLGKSGNGEVLYLKSWGETTGSITTVRVGALSSKVSLLTGIGNDTTMFLSADSLFGKLYMAISDGLEGRTRLLVYDGTSVKVAGQDPTSQVPSDATHDVTAVAGAGGLDVGTHGFVWLYLLKSGYITKWGLTDTFSVPDAATTKLDVKGAPIGPPDTVARILAITPANDPNFFWVPDKTVIWDNTTRAMAITVTEDEVLNGEPVREYATLYTPAAPLGVVAYADRLFLWGCREKAETASALTTSPNGFTTRGLPNLSFDGGFQQSGDTYYTSASQTLPNYWLAAGGGYTGYGPGANGDTLLITGPSVVGQGCSVSKSIDNLYVRPGQQLTMRMRARVSSGIAAGQITVQLKIYDTAGATLTTITKNLFSSSTSTDWQLYSTTDSAVLPGFGPPNGSGGGATADPTATLTITTAVQPTTGATFEIDWVEIYDSLDASYKHTLRGSRAGNPESFDAQKGIVSVGPDDGEGVRCCFRLRDSLYIAKERSLYVTKDTGDEPWNWPVDLVDKYSGTPSLRGVGFGEGWVAIAARVGLVIFDGASPQIVSQEIDPVWQTINWATDTTYLSSSQTWVCVDPAKKLIRIGARTLYGRRSEWVSPSYNDLLLTLDYSEGFDSPVPNGTGRKWTVETVYGASSTARGYHDGVMVVDTDGTVKMVQSQTGNGSHFLVTQKSAAVAGTVDDYAGPINCVYETAPIGSEIGRCVFDRLVARISGSGTLTFAYDPPSGTPVTIGTAALASAPEHDLELGWNYQGTVAGLKLSHNASGIAFSLKRLAAFLKTAPYGVLRAHN